MKIFKVYYKASLMSLIIMGLSIGCVGGSSNSIEDSAEFKAYYEEERSKLNWAYTATENYFKCSLPGQSPSTDWLFNWGLLGIWCDPAALSEYYSNVGNTVKNRYSSLIIPDRNSTWEVRKPIIAKLVKLVTVNVNTVLNERGLYNSIPAAEKNAMIIAVVAKLYQESSLSMYKNIDSNLRLMRGDYGHGHGIAQIDDRYHFVQLFQNNVTWDLLHNLNYGMNFFLDKWQEVKTKAAANQVACVKPGSTDYYLQLSRSAYSLYNAGSFTKVCRWTNTADAWYKNDENYYGKYVEVNDPVKRASYNWDFDYVNAKAGVTDIDIKGILNLPSLPGDEAQVLPQSAHPYANNLNETKSYTVAGAPSIQVSFDALTEVENGYDKIHVLDYDSKDITGSPFTGKTLANQTLTINGNTVRVKLVSDGSVATWGYKVNSVTAANNNTALPESVHNYDNNANDTKTYTLAAASNLAVVFDSRTSVESGYDFIHIKDFSGKAVAGSPFTGKTLAGKTINVPGNTVKITLTSDSSIVDWGYKVNSVTAAAATPVNTQVLPESEHNYTNDLNNRQSYTISGASSIKVTFDSRTDVEDGYDFIHVLDKNENPVAGSPFTGTSLASKTITVSGDTVKILLISDYSVSKWGYKVTSITP